MSKIKSIRKRAEKAFNARALWDPILRDVYDYVIPHRGLGWNRTKSKPISDHVFDSTAMKAAWRFAGRMQSDFTPPGDQFFTLVAGPALKGADKAKAKAIDEQLERISAATTAALATSSFELSSHEMYFDLIAGTGAMLGLKGSSDDIVSWISVPIFELALEAGPYNAIWGRHWRRSWPAAQIAEMWPDGKFGDDLKEQIKSEDDKPVEICQSTTWSADDRAWQHHVFARQSGGKGDDLPEIWHESLRVDPWVTPRFSVVPGEVYGRGPAMFALPSVKSANKARELALKSAAFALLGLWARRSDSAFNPKTARFEPGAMWQVSSTGGPLGPTLQRLDVPSNFDISHVVMQDERLQIQQMMFDEQLPPEAGAVRSPTEIIERVKRLSQDYGGVLGRMTREIIQPVVRRTINILAEERILETDLTIDQLSVGLKVTSPIADAKNAAQAKKVVDYWQVLAGLFGPDMIPVATRVEDAIPELGRWLGVPESLIRDGAEAQQLQHFVECMVEKRAAEMAAAAQPPAAPPTAQQLAA